jgi:hypothetical protein
MVLLVLTLPIAALAARLLLGGRSGERSGEVTGSAAPVR